MMIKAGRRANG